MRTGRSEVLAALAGAAVLDGWAPAALCLVPVLGLVAAALGLERHACPLGLAFLSAAAALRLAGAGQEAGAALAVGYGVARAGLAVVELARARPPGAAWRLGGVLLALYLGLVPWVASVHRLEGDEPYYLLVAESLRSDGDVDLADEYAERTSLRFHDEALAPQHNDPRGGRESRHAPFLSLLVLPGYALAGRTGAMATMAAFAALLAVLLAERGARVARSERAGLLVGGAAGLTCPLLVYAFQVWTEVPAAVLALLLLGDLEPGRQPRPVRAGLWALGLVLLKVRFGLLALPLVLAALLLTRRGRRVVAATAALFGAGLALLLAINRLSYGRALRMQSFGELWLDPGYLPCGLGGLLFDHAYGLLPFAPHAALIAVGAGAAARLRRSELWLALAGTLPYLLVLGQRPWWFGDWSPPARYLFAPVALLAPLAALGLETGLGLRTRALWAAAVLWSALLGLALTIQPGLAYSVFDGTSQLSNRLSIALDADAVRLLPSFRTPRLPDWVAAAAGVLVLGLAVVAGRRSAGGGERQPAGGARSVPRAAVAVSAVLGALALAAHAVPTHVVELEHRHVRHSAGRFEPELFAHQRVERPRSGWLLPPGAWSEARVRLPAGAWRAIVVGRSAGAAAARGRLAVDSVERAFELPPGDWREQAVDMELGADGSRLRLVNDSAESALLLDRVRFEPLPPARIAGRAR